MWKYVRGVFSCVKTIFFTGVKKLLGWDSPAEHTNRGVGLHVSPLVAYYGTGNTSRPSTAGEIGSVWAEM